MHQRPTTVLGYSWLYITFMLDCNKRLQQHEIQSVDGEDYTKMWSALMKPHMKDLWAGQGYIHTHVAWVIWAKLPMCRLGTPGPHFVVLYKHMLEKHNVLVHSKKKIPPLGKVFPLGTARTNTNIETYPKVLQRSWTWYNRQQEQPSKETKQLSPVSLYWKTWSDL